MVKHVKGDQKQETTGSTVEFPEIEKSGVQVFKPSDRWQVERPKWTQQNQYLLQNELYTDCTFLVGHESINTQKFKAHKVLLAKVSSVFAAMLYGSLAADKNKEEIYNIALEPEIFQAVLEYLYTEHVDLSELGVTLELCRVADMYDLPGLLQYCVDHLLSILNPDNACQAFNIGHQFKQMKLEQLAWKMIIERTNEVLSGDGFDDALQSTLLAISTQEELHIDSEEQLVNACFNWAVHEAERKGLDTKMEGLREALGPVLKNLRFLCLTILQFAKGPAKSLVLTADEKVAFSIKICNPNDNDVETPLGFSILTKERIHVSIQQPKFTFKNNVTSTLHVANCKQCTCYNANSGSTASLCFEVDCNIRIHGICFPAGNNDWQILLVDLNEQKILNTKNVIVKDTSTDKKIMFEDPIFVEYNNIIQLNVTSTTTCVAATVPVGVIPVTVAQNIFTDHSFVANPITSVITGIIYTKC